MTEFTPEARAAIWKRLEEMARSIEHNETRAQYLATWRARFDREVSAAAEVADELPPLHALIEAEEGGYAWPEDIGESERRLIVIARRLLELRATRKEITESIKDLTALAKAAGFTPKALNAVLRDLEADSEVREGYEAIWALYRRVLGVKGPMSEAMMPAAIDPREVKVTNAVQRRLSKAMALMDARAHDPRGAIEQLSDGSGHV